MPAKDLTVAVSGADSLLRRNPTIDAFISDQVKYGNYKEPDLINFNFALQPSFITGEGRF